MHNLFRMHLSEALEDAFHNFDNLEVFELVFILG